MSVPTIAVTVITIGGVCTAILGIIKFCQKIITDPVVHKIEAKIDEKVDPIVKRQVDMQKQATDKFEQMDEQQKDIQLRLLRLEILNLLHNDPKNLDTILETFDEYKELGGNHYIDAVIAKWKKEQGID